MIYAKLFMLSVSAALFITSCAEGPADLVLKGGKIATVDEAFSIAEAVAIKGEKFIFVGSSAEVESFIGNETEVIELDGKLAVPGLIDAHAHMLSFGESLENLNFVGSTSYQQIIDIVTEKVKTVDDGEWILGRGWDQNDWKVKEFPVHDALSKISPENPVWLTRVDGHAALANAKAMETAGITAGTPDPEGGKIHRKADGSPTGIFIDNAMDFVESKIPPLSSLRRKAILEKAANACIAVGLTGVHDAGVDTEVIDDYKYLIDNGKLGVRIYAMLSDPGIDDLETFFKQNKLTNYGDHFLSVRSLKLIVDGALGSRGAALLEPYSDDPGNDGLLITPYERIEQAAKAALKAGFQVNSHAIGDRANRLVLDAYEAALQEHPNPDHRFRDEHSQIVATEDIHRFTELGVLPSMQPTHATSDMYWAEDRVGPERIKGAYAWQDFIRAGLKIPCGSDFPVESANPMLGIYAAVTRQDIEEFPEGGWMTDQCMTREQALKGFTIWAAYGAFQEKMLGSIEVGKLADIVVLSSDILTVPPKEILSTMPVYTIVDGIVRYRGR